MVCFGIIGVFVLGSRGRAIVPTRLQSIGELIYGFIYKMVEDVTGKDGVKYFPYIMTLFIFILFANYLALMPMSYSHDIDDRGDGGSGFRCVHRGDDPWFRQERRMRSLACSG